MTERNVYVDSGWLHHGVADYSMRACVRRLWYGNVPEIFVDENVTLNFSLCMILYGEPEQRLTHTPRFS
jgi:hypothetical protein